MKDNYYNLIRLIALLSMIPFQTVFSSHKQAQSAPQTFTFSISDEDLPDEKLDLIKRLQNSTPPTPFHFTKEEEVLFVLNNIETLAQLHIIKADQIFRFPEPEYAQIKTLLQQAAMAHNKVFMKNILAAGADINYCPTGSIAPISMVASCPCPQSLSCLKFLIKHKAKVNPENNMKPGPLLCAVSIQASEAVKLLLKNKANPNAPKGCPLALAIKHPSLDIIQELLDAKADPHLISNKNSLKNFLSNAIRTTDHTTCQAIIESIIKTSTTSEDEKKRAYGYGFFEDCITESITSCAFALLHQLVQNPLYVFKKEHYALTKTASRAKRQALLKVLSKNFKRSEHRSDLITMSIEHDPDLLHEILDTATPVDVLTTHYTQARSQIQINKIKILKELINFDMTHDNEARAKKYEYLIIPVNTIPQPVASVPTIAPAAPRAPLEEYVAYTRASASSISSVSMPSQQPKKLNKKKKKQKTQQKIAKPAIQVSASQKPKSAPVVQQKPEPLSSYSREERAGILATGAQVIAKLNREEDALGLPEIASEPVVAPAAEEPLDKVAAASYPETITVDGISIGLRHILDPKAEKPGLHHHTPAELEALRKSKAIIGESQVDALGIFKAIITGKPCTCFPANWSRDKVASVIAGALISGKGRSLKPTHTKKKKHSGYELTATVTVDGLPLTLKLILNQQCDKVITAYPLYEPERAFPEAVTVKW